MLEIADNTLADSDSCVLSDLLYDDIIKFELHGFSDDSKIALLLVAKSKLCPVEMETKPILELNAAVVLTVT